MARRSVVELTRPEVEPVSLTMAKDQLGILAEQEDDHALILRLISAGRGLVEKRLGVCLAARQYRATFELEGERRLQLPAPPLLLDVDHPLVVTVDGTTINSATYTIDSDSQPAEVLFDAALPCSGWGTLNQVKVTFWAGPAPGQQIEAGLESVILLFVAHWYKNREAVLTGTIAVALPAGCETLLAAHSVTGAW